MSGIITDTTSARTVDAETERQLREAYGQLVKAGDNSVRAAWRFGQRVLRSSRTYAQRDLAAVMGRSVGTLRRYARLCEAYQTAELAVEASRRLETFNIDLLVSLANLGIALQHRPLAGRRYRYRCACGCGSTDVKREEITDPAELAELEASK